MRNQYGSKNSMWKGGKIKVFCGVCKTEYFIYPSEIKKIKTCSKKCHSKLISQKYQGKNNPCWRGDNAKYHALHYRVRKENGTPQYCEICKTMSKNKKYEWANMTGDYKNIKDYKRMCAKCHRIYDKNRRVKNV